MQKTESAFRSFFDHSDDGMLLVDSTGIVREWSKGYDRISGLSKEEVIGKMTIWKVAKLLFPFEKRTKEEFEGVKADLMETVANMQQKNLVRHVRNIKTNEYRIFNDLYFPVAMPDEIMLACISRDVTEEVRSREHLEEKERKISAEKERLETLSDNLPEGTMYRFVHNFDTGKRYMEYVSGTWEKVTGLTPESVAEDIKAFDDVIFPKDWPYMNRANNITTADFSKFKIEVRINKKGKLHWLRIASRPYMDGNKMIWDGVMTDITAQKEVEAELTKHREELEFLVKERTEKLETAYEELYASNEELDEYRSKLEWMVEQKTAEIVVQKRDLEVYSQQQSLLVKVLHIIQSNKNLPQAINVSLAKIGKYAGVSRIYIFEKSADESFFKCIYEWLNTGITHTVKDLNLPIKILQPIFDEFIRNELVCASDVCILSPDLVEILEEVEVKSTVCLPLTANGIIYGFVGFDECTAKREWEQSEVDLLKSLSQIISTATSRYHAEIELISAKEKAEESDKLKSAFLANMSHEIRTPLNSITGFLHFLTADNLSPERKHEYINVINNSSAQLVKLIDDIVDVAKIEAKQLNINPVPVQINNLMKELQIFFETYMQTLNKSNIILILDDSGFVDNCTVMVDPVRLRQVLTNLIGNAVKFTEKGYIRFGYRQSAPNKLEFVVEDTGIGMALDTYEIVFERFRKIGNNFHEGLGLGLNIAHTLVQMMGGDIWLETTEGVGTTFYFTISYQTAIQ